MKVYDDNWDGGRVPLDIDQVRPGIAVGMDFETVGRRVKERRRQLGISASEIAARARISRQTLAKFEAGQPFKHSTLRRLMFVLGVYPQDLRDPTNGDEFARLQEVGDIKWSAAYSKSRYIKDPKSAIPSDLQDSAERARLGTAGLQPFFVSMFNNRLPGGALRNPGLMELHQSSWFDQHPGEECVYCLRGVVKMIVRDQEFVLNPGSCLVFNAFEPHKYVPEAHSPDGLPPLIFVVLVQSSEDAQRGVRTWPTDEQIREAKASSKSPG